MTELVAIKVRYKAIYRRGERRTNRPPRKTYEHGDTDSVTDHRPTHAEMQTLLKSQDPGVKRDLLQRVCDRVHEAGLREGRGYVATPDLTLRRLAVGLQHAISHVHRHCNHQSDWMERLPISDEDEDDDSPSAPSLSPRSASLHSNSWRRCTKSPCKSVVTLIGECRLWDLIDSHVPHTHQS